MMCTLLASELSRDLSLQPRPKAVLLGIDDAGEAIWGTQHNVLTRDGLGWRETQVLCIGDTVTVRGGFGRELPERVIIAGIGTEGGRTVIDYIDGNGRARWAYAHQIDRGA